MEDDKDIEKFTEEGGIADQLQIVLNDLCEMYGDYRGVLAALQGLTEASLSFAYDQLGSDSESSQRARRIDRAVYKKMTNQLMELHAQRTYGATSKGGEA